MPANSIVNIPPKQILCNFRSDNSLTNLDFYPYQNGNEDRWWEGGTNPTRYTWELILNVDPREHGSHLTPTPFIFDGRDVDVGDWLTDNNGNIWYIRSVISKSRLEVTLIIEDWNRYNIFNSNTGTGSPTSGDFIIFETNEVGEPMFTDIPLGYVSGEFYANVNSYFKYVNPCRNYTIKQDNHGFKIGQKISVQKTNPNFVLTTNDNVSSFVGTISQVFSKDHFMFAPNTRITPLKTAYGFDVGAKLYFNDNTLSEEKGSMLFYIVIRKELPSVITGNRVSPVLEDGSKFKIGDFEVTTGTTISSVVDFINNSENNTLYTSSMVGSPTLASINPANALAYGVIGGFVPFSVNINGQIVEFTDSTNGSAAYGMPGIADHVDIANTINSSGLDGIFAEVGGSNVRIINSNGGEISLQTVSPDGSGVSFAGNNSITGLPEYTPPSEDSFIRISRLDGGEIRFTNIIGNPVGLLGLSQSRSGQYPMVLAVEQGIRKGDSYVVENIGQRDELDVIVGDQAFVLDSGNGEWSQYMYTTTGWVLTATQDSARTDADVLTLTLTHEDEAGKYVIGTLSDNSRVIDISVKVNTPFSVDASLDVGDSDVIDRIISDNVIDLTNNGVYSNSPSYVYKSGSDTDIIVDFDPADSESGEVKIVISYT